MWNKSFGGDLDSTATRRRSVVQFHYITLVMLLWSQRVLLQLCTLTDVTDAILRHIKKRCHTEKA